MKKLGNLMVKFISDLQVPLRIFDAYNEYVNKSKTIFASLFLVTQFQRKWRHYSEMNKARVHIFMKGWNRFVLHILEEESKKKKKRYTEHIMKVKEYNYTLAKLIF